MSSKPEDQIEHSAHCSCGGLRLSVRGRPRRVYACACLECQRATGTAFAYRARYGRENVVVEEGERRRYRRVPPSGKWMDHVFCPNCGTLLYMEAEAIPGEIVVSVGCFDRPDFGPPSALFWSKRKPRWLHFEEAVEQK